MSHDRLFTPSFFVMCGFTFTVFLSAFQLLPTAPFHIIDLGGSTFASGLFLGFLTYASALSAPITGAFADRAGQRRILIVTSLALAVFSGVYVMLTDYRLMLGLAILHGIFWSGLLSASAAYMTHLLPEHRRAEGIGYWGLSTLLAVAVSPTVGFWIYRRGWLWLCVFAATLNLIILAAFDTGIGTGSTTMGWLIERYGFANAFAAAAALSALALPYFLAVDKWYARD